MVERAGILANEQKCKDMDGTWFGDFNLCVAEGNMFGVFADSLDCTCDTTDTSEFGGCTCEVYSNGRVSGLIEASEINTKREEEVDLDIREL